jgi:hypothetical protein
MACVNQHHITSPNFSDVTSSSYIRARRPALIPSNCSLTLAEAQDLVRTRIHGPLFPPPDPQLLRNVRAVSPTESNSSSVESSSSTATRSSIETMSLPSSKMRHARRPMNWAKAQAHYARDRNFRSCSPRNQNHKEEVSSFTTDGALIDVSPKRKHSTPVVEEELKCQLEDRVGTPHPCTFEPDDDEVLSQLNLEILKVGSELAVLEDESAMAMPLVAGNTTSEPAETKGVY